MQSLLGLIGRDWLRDHYQVLVNLLMVFKVSNLYWATKPAPTWKNDAFQFPNDYYFQNWVVYQN